MHTKNRLYIIRTYTVTCVLYIRSYILVSFLEIQYMYNTCIVFVQAHFIGYRFSKMLTAQKARDGKEI